MKKIKIFLGGYVNFLNAQNINCRALSEYMDKEKFEISTMMFPRTLANARDFKPTHGVKYIQQYRPLRFFGRLGFLRGIANADVAYLPKGDYDVFCRFIAKICGTKVFTTLEGILDGILLSKVANPQKYINHFRKYEPNLYSITKYIANHECDDKGFHFAPEILYLGVDTCKFLVTHDPITELNNIIFIGNDLVRKNCLEFLDVACCFSDIIFHVVGGDQLLESTIQDFLQKKEIQNVVYHGRLDHTQIAELLKNMDLMFFPSRSEGFPKVMLEAACAGVPTLCYNDYGADEWITTGKDGFVVSTKEEAFTIIRNLKDNPEKLKELSRNAVELGKCFDWKILVKDWEKVIEDIYKGK